MSHPQTAPRHTYFPRLQSRRRHTKRTKLNGSRSPWSRAEEQKNHLLKKLREAEQQQDFYSGLYRQYTTNLLKLAIYVRSLPANERIREFLRDRQSEHKTSVLAKPASAEAAPRGNEVALASMYYEPLKKVRVDTVRPSVSRKVETHTRDLSYTVGVAPRYLADDHRRANVSDSQSDVDDLFAEWDSDPLGLLSLPDLGE